MSTHWFDQQSLRASGWRYAAWRVLLLVGFLAVAAAAVVAHMSPATGYELSIYRSTPVAFWAGAGLALGSSLLVAFYSPRRSERRLALFLAGLTVLSITALPLLRGYAFHSGGDPLTHLGWARSVLWGDIELATLLYPGLHGVSILVHRVLGVGLKHAMMLTTSLFVLVFVVFLPLFVYTVTDDLTVTAVGVFATLMLLPINNISTHLTAFPSTLAIFFTPLVLVLTLVYLTERGHRSWVHPMGVLLALASATTVLVHPQQASNLLLIVATVTVAVTVKQRVLGSFPDLRPLYGQTLFLSLVLVLWGVTHERASEAVAAYSGSVFKTLAGTSGGAGALAQRTGSLADIGASPGEIGIKLFLVSSVFLLLTAYLLGRDLTGRMERFAPRVRTLSSFGLALPPIGVIMLLYMVGNLQTIYFRHFGFIMLIATVFGAIVLGRRLTVARDVNPQPAVAGIVVIGIAVMLTLSLLTVFPSPFIYKANGHVTEAELAGHEMAFEAESPAVGYVGIRTGPDRYRDATEGVLTLGPRSERRESRVPYGRLGGDLTSEFEGPRYVVVSESDVQRETVAFRSLRYSADGFRSLGTGDEVDRVLSNGDVQLYYVQD